MNPKKIIGTVMVVLVIAAGVWWFLQPASAPVKVAVTGAAKPFTTPESHYAIDPKSAALHPPPSVPLALPPPRTPEAPRSPTAPPSGPQADLKTAIPDIADLYGKHDMVELYQIYTPPGEIDAQKLQNLREKEQELKTLFARDAFVQRVTQDFDDLMARSWKSLENQTPTFNAAGDEATYTLTVSTGVSDPKPRPVTFVKINGKWYLKPDGG